jgi:hypothetical protein
MTMHELKVLLWKLVFSKKNQHLIEVLVLSAQLSCTQLYLMLTVLTIGLELLFETNVPEATDIKSTVVSKVTAWRGVQNRTLFLKHVVCTNRDF